MPSFTSPQKTFSVEENVLPKSEFSKVAEPPTSSIASSPTIKPSSSRKSSKVREAELTLQLLEAEKPDEESFRKQHEALEISMNAREQVMLNFDSLKQFCKTRWRFDNSKKANFT